MFSIEHRMTVAHCSSPRNPGMVTLMVSVGSTNSTCVSPASFVMVHRIWGGEGHLQVPGYLVVFFWLCGWMSTTKKTPRPHHITKKHADLERCHPTRVGTTCRNSRDQLDRDRVADEPKCQFRAASLPSREVRFAAARAHEPARGHGDRADKCCIRVCVLVDDDYGI